MTVFKVWTSIVYDKIGNLVGKIEAVSKVIRKISSLFRDIMNYAEFGFCQYTGD